MSLLAHATIVSFAVCINFINKIKIKIKIKKLKKIKKGQGA